MADGLVARDHPASPSRNGWLLAAAGVCAVTALEAFAQLPLWGPDTVLAVINLATLVTFMITGLLLKDEPGQRGTAWALILAGITRPLGWLNRWGTGPLPLYASIFGDLDDIFGAWALLRYPNHRLRRHQRLFLTMLGTWLIGGPAFSAVISKPAWQHFSRSSWWPAWFPDRSAYAVASQVVDAGALALSLIFIALLLSRYFRAKGMDRLVITPVIVAAVVSAIAAAAVVTGLFFSKANDSLFTVEGAAELVVPLAFLISVIQRRIARGGVAGLTVQLAGQDTTKPVHEALRRVLHDPRLDICYWVPASRIYVDSTGQPADPEHPGLGRLAIPITGSDGKTPLAVILADHSTGRDRLLLAGAVSASRMALENARLQADLQAQLKETRASRARIVEAGLAERRRIERNLHDGAQQRLLALAAKLTATRVKATDPAVITAMDHVGAELLEALSELRVLARGILPPVLGQSGIGAAVEGVIERLPIPVRLEVSAHRFAAALEATAYFVISEALANTVKHAQARTAEVHVRQQGQALMIQIDDDGQGGADPAGPGLAALADRVTTLGGQLTVMSPLGHGTHLIASIPCA